MRTRRTAPVKEDDNLAHYEYDEQTSDDDAPEEVSLAASKQSAATLRKEQQQARLEALRHAKEQRRRQQQKNDSEADPASLSHPEDVVRIQQDTDEALEQDLDYLPEDVLQALAEQPPPTKQQQQQAVVTAQLRNSRLGKQQKRKEFAEREAGPVKVQILSRVGDAGASEAARAFLQHRLHDKLKRTTDMLRPTKYQNVFNYEPKVSS